MKKIYILISIILFTACLAFAAKYPSFMKRPASVIESEYSLLGMRDIEFDWGGEHIWLSEIFQSWGRKGTTLLWKQLQDEEKIKLIEYFAEDKEGRIFYFNKKIAFSMNDMLKQSVQWIPLRESHLAGWLPDIASDTLHTADSFQKIPDIINEVNITGLPVYKEYIYFLKLLRKDTAGLKEIAYRIARLSFIYKNPIMKDVKEITISVIVESLLNNMVTDVKRKKLSPLSRTTISYAEDVLKSIHDDPAFSTFYNNTHRLQKYYTRIMHDEIKTVKKLLKKLQKLDEKNRLRAAEFSAFITKQSLAMEVLRDGAAEIHQKFIELAQIYRTQELSGKISLMPQFHTLKEDLRSTVIKAEKLHAESIEEVQNVLAPGDASSARRLIKQLQAPLDEIHNIMTEMLTEIEVLGQAGGEIGLLVKEIDLLMWKLTTHKRLVEKYSDFFHRGFLRGDFPSFNAGDTSAPLTPRAGMPQEANVLAYSFQQVFLIYEDYDMHEQIFYHLKLLLEKYPVQEIESPDKINALHEAQEKLKSIRINFIDNKFFFVKLEEMRDDLRVYGINEYDLLEMVQGRTPGLEPAFIETIEGQGIVPATP